jgi:hypothetical protein
MSDKTEVHYPEPHNSLLQQRIVEIVRDHSGGIKFLELVLDLAELDVDFRKEYSFNPDRFIYDVEWYCRNTESLKVLDYTMTSMNRAKMFVYTP